MSGQSHHALLENLGVSKLSHPAMAASVECHMLAEPCGPSCYTHTRLSIHKSVGS